MIPILVEEPHFLVVDKPAGWLCQAPPGVPDLQSELTAQLKLRDGHGGQPFVGLPHRLDRSTTGALLIARNQRALKRFGQQFHSRKIGKYYLAVVESELEPGRLLRWEDFVRKIPNAPRAEIVPEGHQGGRHASLQATVLAAHAGMSLLGIALETGRMHQIRVQAAARGSPIVGDWIYGARSSLVEFSEDAGLQSRERHMRIALHALRLEFHHPQTARRLGVTAPLPAHWNTLPEAILAVAGCNAVASARATGLGWNWVSGR